MTAPMFVLEVSLEPYARRFYTIAAGTDLDELVEKAEGFIKALYGFVTDCVVNEPDDVAWAHPGQPVGGQYVAFIHTADRLYADLMDEAQTRQPVLEDSYWLMLMEGAAIEAAHRLKARGGAGRETRVPPGVAQRIDAIRQQQGVPPLYSGEGEKVA